ncbi:hypothetical protein ACFFK0_08065 [Paenibacillus chartarius]|uniref:Uncharacterized protein n=1 Tax=Paenibacillus chartarius TaxID=747481 RepID=A0ABV6DIF2_9BACL
MFPLIGSGTRHAKRFIFESQLEDLALHEDVLTAKHAVQRIEFRGSDVNLEGSPIPTEAYSGFLLCVLLSAGAACWFDREVMDKW